MAAWGKNDNAITLNKHVDDIQRIGYDDAFNSGAAWGDGITTDISSVAASLSGAGAAAEATSDAETMNQIAENTGNTAAAAGKIADSVDISNEQLQYMRDLAERETINRYTTAEIKVDMTNNNNISSNVDFDDFLGQIANGISEAAAIGAEGVH